MTWMEVDGEDPRALAIRTYASCQSFGTVS
jgi:hypothetical protein